MKCWVLLVNRGRGRLFKKGGSYSASDGVVKDFLRRERFRFYISDTVSPIELDLSSATAKNRTIPLFVVNELTSVASGVRNEKTKTPDKKETISVHLIEKSDPDIHTKLNLLIKRSFFEALARKLKLRAVDMIIYMGAGYGLLRFIEYVVRIVVLHQG
jgi:hypothetical protein